MTIIPVAEQPQQHPFVHETCRQCAHRVTWGFYHSDRRTQHREMQPTRHNRTGLKRIKVTDQACSYFKIKDSNEHK